MRPIRPGTSGPKLNNKSLVGDPPSREVAPIEDITRGGDGLGTTLIFTFTAVEGEEPEPSSINHGG
ncbi:hypothetical protein SAMD00023353_1600840 [Rosellinia necatrix]|uniref:Uncharacterized protein n=1 Tax=Rosellinia necatrix TaxID=77044 RepID=A0A1S8A7A4_ROSNE|nr:hypothetical protein SAMD00023353_1600840 [Rosellinia necatrix]